MWLGPTTLFFFFFFFNDTATTEIYTLSLHDALPISLGTCKHIEFTLAHLERRRGGRSALEVGEGDRKSTRLNSSHMSISYAVFCLKKKNTIYTIYPFLPKNKNKQLDF